MVDAKEYFDLLPQHKKMLKEYSKMIYDLNVSDEEVDLSQKKESYINFNFRQAEYLRRGLIIEKFCDPILEEANQHATVEIREFFASSLIQPYFHELSECFRLGSLLATISICRSSLEVGLREAVAYRKAKQKHTNILEEYGVLEWTLLGPLLQIAEEMDIIESDHVNRIFTPLHLLPEMEDPGEYRKLLDKFIHGSYSDLFMLVNNITIEGEKPRDFRDFIDKLTKMQGNRGMPDLSKLSYFNMVRHEKVAFYFMFGLFEFVRIVYFERLVSQNI